MPLSYEEMPVWHNMLVTSPLGHTYHSPKLVRVGKLLYYHLFGDGGVPYDVWRHIAPIWKGHYDLLSINQAAPPACATGGGEVVFARDIGEGLAETIHA